MFSVAAAAAASRQENNQYNDKVDGKKRETLESSSRGYTHF